MKSFLLNLLGYSLVSFTAWLILYAIVNHAVTLGIVICGVLAVVYGFLDDGK